MSIEIANPFLQPLGTQRYHQALAYIQSLKPKFIIDFGCSECNFLFYLSRNPDDLQFAIGVDVNERTLLKGYRSISVPGAYYLHTRPFTVYLMKDDITKLSEEFISKYQNCPFITIIEVIEHLTEEDLNLAIEQIFGKLNPMAIYLTTPNIEYNDTITENFEKDRRVGQFRHADHKFEWTRSEFRDWVNKTCKQYNYSATIEGVGRCVGDEEKNLGFASHSVLFKCNKSSLEKVDQENFEPPESFLYKNEFQIKIEGDFKDEDKAISYGDYDGSTNSDDDFLRGDFEEEEEENEQNEKKD